MNNKVLIDRELLEELADYCSDSRSYNEAIRVLATPAPIPDADHSEDVRAMVRNRWKLAPVEPTPKMIDATWHKMGAKVGAAYSDSAHAIIDGLRGEVAQLKSALAGNSANLFDKQQGS